MNQLSTNAQAALIERFKSRYPKSVILQPSSHWSTYMFCKGDDANWTEWMDEHEVKKHLDYQDRWDTHPANLEIKRINTSAAVDVELLLDKNMRLLVNRLRTHLDSLTNLAQHLFEDSFLRDEKERED